MGRSLTCLDFVEFLDGYLAGALPLEQLELFSLHLAACPSCVAYMKTYRQAAQLGTDVFAASSESVPSEIPPELLRAILNARQSA
jgi:anti-sigma factor RsiW